MVLVTNPDGSTVNVPERYLNQYLSANRAVVGQRSYTPPPPPKRKSSPPPSEEKRMTAAEKIAEKKRRREEEGVFYRVSGQGEKTFEELSPKEQRAVLRNVNPVSLAQQGILAPSENVFFKTRDVTKAKQGEGDSTVRFARSQTLESNFKNYILSGNTEGINRYLAEIAEKEGPRAAVRAREELIAMGVEHTSLELARRSGGTGAREQRVEKEAAQRKSARVLEQGQKGLNLQVFGPQVRGELGATFDMRKDVPKRVEVQGPVQQIVTGYVVDGKTFKTLKEAQDYQKTQTVESTIPLYLLPNPIEQKDEGKSELKKSIESAYKFLETKSKDPNIRQDSEGSALVVELGKAGLQFTGSILNLAEQVDTSVGRGYQNIRGVQGPNKPTQPISFPSHTAESIPINAIFEKGLSPEAAKQFMSESKEYVNKYGWKPYVVGSSLNLIGVGGAVKTGTQLTTKGITKLAARLPEKIVTPLSKFKSSVLESRPITVIKPKQVKTYPEIAIQKQLTPAQIQDAQRIMKRITTKQDLLERFGQSTTLDKRKLSSLTPSQKDVRLVATKQKNVQPDSSYRPRGRNEGGFKDILERGTPVGFKETRVSLGTAEGKLPRPVKTDYADQKFRDFIGVAESGFSRTPVSLGSSVIRKVKQPRPPNYDLASEEARNFFKLIEEPKSKRYANIVGEIKLSKDFIPNKYPSPPKIENLANKPKPVEEDPLFRNILPMKRLGGTKKGTTIKRKSDIDKMLGTGELIGPIKETKVSLGYGTGIITKTKGKKDLETFETKLFGKKPGKAKTEFPKDTKKYREIKSGGSITLQEVKTEKILKPKIIAKQQLKTESILKKKPKTPVGITWTVKKDTKIIPKPTSKPPVVFQTLEQKKKRKQRQTSVLTTSNVVVESILLNKNRPQLKTESKPKLRTGLSMDLYSSSKIAVKPKQSSILISKPKMIIKQKTALKERAKLKTRQREVLLYSPKQKAVTKQIPRQKTKTPQRFPPITRTITSTKRPEITIIRERLDIPPPTKPPALLPPPPPPIIPRKEKKKKKSKGKDTEEFLGSTWEESVLGFRSKKFDITYKKKSISRLLGEEKIKFKRTEFKPRGKSSLSKGKAKKLKDNYSITGKSKVKLF